MAARNDVAGLMDGCVVCGRHSVLDVCHRKKCIKAHGENREQWDRLFSDMETKAKEEIRSDILRIVTEGAEVGGKILLPRRILDLFGNGAMVRRYLSCPVAPDLRILALDTSRESAKAAFEFSKHSNFRFARKPVHVYVTRFVRIKKKLDMAWLDYCGHWGKDRRDDLRALLRHAMANRSMVFVSTKSGRQQNGTEHAFLLWEIPLEVVQIAHGFGFDATPFFRKTYVGGGRARMNVFGFALNRRKSSCLDRMREVLGWMLDGKDVV